VAEGTAPPPTALRPLVTLEALRVTLGRPPIWLLVWSIELLLAFAPALLYHDWIEGALGNHFRPGSLFANLGTDFRFDQRQETALLDSSISRLGGLLVLLAILVSGFSAGGWLQVFLERTEGHSVRRFFFGGSRYFWRFLRLTVLTVVSLALASFVVYGLPWQKLVLGLGLGIEKSDWGKLETLSSERTVLLLRTTQHALFALAFGLVMTWGDYTRTRLALHDTSSAVWAGLCTWFTIFRHPLKTLRPILCLAAVELSIVLGAGWFARVLELDLAARPDMLNVILLFAIGQLVLLWRVALRGARYHAAVQVSREVVRPIARPDPWKASVGGPGGPRYPLGGDEYGMSL
jgi:hypothetical protein